MDNLLRVQIRQTIQDPFSDLSKDLLTSSSAKLLDLAVYTVERATFAELHCNANGGSRWLNEGTVVRADVAGSTILVEAELANDLLLDIGIGVGRNDLGAHINYEQELFKSIDVP